MACTNQCFLVSVGSHAPHHFHHWGLGRFSPRSVGAVHAKPELDGHFGMLGAFQGFLGDSTSSGMTDLSLMEMSVPTPYF